MKTLQNLGLAVSIFVMAGCANLNTQSRHFEGFNTKVITTDASQRAFINVNRKSKANDPDNPIFCAEPSPDGLIAYATAVSGSLNAPGKAALDLALSQQQSAASIGLRTQTIQILRDGMYRLCESYASGAIDKKDMDQLQRRYQNMMMGLLAVEQLTGPVIARQAALSSAVGAAVGKSIGEVVTQLADASNKRAQAKSDEDDASAKVDAKKTELDGLNADKEKNKDAIAKAEKELAELSDAAKKAGIKHKAAKDLYTSVETALKEAQKLVATATGTAQLMDAVTGGSKPGATDYQTAAVTVKEIVMRVLDQNHRSDHCDNFSGRRANAESPTEREATNLYCKQMLWDNEDQRLLVQQELEKNKLLKKELEELKVAAAAAATVTKSTPATPGDNAAKNAPAKSPVKSKPDAPKAKPAAKPATDTPVPGPTPSTPPGPTNVVPPSVVKPSISEARKELEIRHEQQREQLETARKKSMGILTR